MTKDQRIAFLQKQLEILARVVEKNEGWAGIEDEIRERQEELRELLQTSDKSTAGIFS